MNLILSLSVLFMAKNIIHWAIIFAKSILQRLVTRRKVCLCESVCFPNVHKCAPICVYGCMYTLLKNMKISEHCQILVLCGLCSVISNSFNWESSLNLRTICYYRHV